MKNRTTAIILTVVAVLLCGCPGLSLCGLGVYAATGNFPDFFNGYGNFPSWVGFVFMCLAIFFIAIPVVVGILTLRQKKAPAEAEAMPPMPPTPPQDPLPPAS
ncbi:MAG TPA: hypothetical protein VMC09_15565 [Anaerolineales bacterium]|nr:hypothetical protein [Anaerolineales bacterium]